MVDVLNPKDENELAGDRDLKSPRVAPQATSASAPQLSKQSKEQASSPVQQPANDSGAANQQQSPVSASQGVPTGQGENITEFVPQPVPLQFEQVPQPGYRGDLINSINPEAEIQEELLQKQAQNAQDTFNLGLLGIQSTPEKTVDTFDWTEGRPIDEIRDTLDVPHYAGLNGSGLNFLGGSGEVSERSDTASSDLAIASQGTRSELADTLRSKYDPDDKFNTSRGLLSFFSLPIRALTGIDLSYLASRDFYNNEATDSEKDIIDRYGADNAAALIYPNKVLERLDRQYAETVNNPRTADKPKSIEPSELNFNIWEGQFGDFGNAGLLSGAAYLLNLPENIIMAAVGELVEQFNENIPGRERNRFLDVLAGRDLGIFEQRTSDYKLFSIIPPEDLEHGVKVSEYEEATGRTIPGILRALWDNPEFIQEEYGVSKELARLPMYAVLGAALVGSASVDDLFWKPIKAAGKLSGLTSDIAEEAVMRELRRLRKVGLTPDAPDFTPQAAQAVTRIAEIPAETKLLPPPAPDAPSKELVAEYISKKFGAEHVPPILYEDNIGRFQVLEWRDKTVPERIIKVTDTTEPKSSLDLYVRKVMEDRPVGGALSPIVEERGKLLVRSSDAKTESVVLLDKTEPQAVTPWDPALDPWDTRKSIVELKEEFEELRTATANTTNLQRAEELNQEITAKAPTFGAVVKAEELTPPSRPAEILEELKRNPSHRVAKKDVTTVRRTNSELTWVGKHNINPDTGKPFVNPNRRTPLTTAQIDNLYREHGELFSRYGAQVEPTLSVATHVEITPGRIRKLRRAEEIIEPPLLDVEVIKPPTFNDYKRQRNINKSRLRKAVTPDEIITEKQQSSKLLARLEASMEPSELFKVKQNTDLPIRLTSDIPTGERLVDLQRNAKATRSDIVKLTEEVQELDRIVKESGTALDQFRRFTRKDLGADLATKQLFGEAVPPINTYPADVAELEDVSVLPNLSPDTVVFFGASSPQNIRAMSIDEIEVSDLGLGLVGFKERVDIAESNALRTRQVNAIPMGMGPPKVYAVNTSKLNLLDGNEVAPNYLRGGDGRRKVPVKNALIDAITKVADPIDLNRAAIEADIFADLISKPIGKVLSELKGKLINLYSVSELEYRNIIDEFQRTISVTYDGVAYQDIYTVWNPEKLRPLEIRSLPEPEANVARLADYTVDSFLDGKFNTPTSTANRLKSYHDLAQSQYDDVAERLAEVTKRQVELNRDIIDTELALKRTNRDKTRSLIKTLENQSVNDFTNTAPFMKPDYPDPC